MNENERDTVRQVLEAILKNLRGDADAGEPGSESTALRDDRWRSTDTQGSGAPILIMVAGDLKGRLPDAAGPGSGRLNDTSEPAKVNACVSDYSQRKVSHPGLERFTMIEAESNPSVPKPCFMEPARVCVNSGVCEMRGF